MSWPAANVMVTCVGEVVVLSWLIDGDCKTTFTTSESNAVAGTVKDVAKMVPNEVLRSIPADSFPLTLRPGRKVITTVIEHARAISIGISVAEKFVEQTRICGAAVNAAFNDLFVSRRLNRGSVQAVGAGDATPGAGVGAPVLVPVAGNPVLVDVPGAKEDVVVAAIPSHSKLRRVLRYVSVGNVKLGTAGDV